MNKIMELERDLESLKNNAETLKNEGKIDEAFEIVNQIKERGNSKSKSY